MGWKWMILAGGVVALVGCSPQETHRDAGEDVGGFGVEPDAIGEPEDTGGDDAGADGDAADAADAADTDVAQDDVETATDCVPGADPWEETIEPIVEHYCGDCHGETPQYGAPYSLTDYDEIVDGEPGERKVDAMADVLMAGEMPPPGYPPVPHAELDALVAWATCGEQHPDYGAELEASAPIWEAPDEAPEGLESFDVTADEYEVGSDVLDEYRCFAAEVPIGSEQFIRRIEPVIDDGRVLHHTLVSIDRSQQVSPGSFGCPMFPPGDEYLYAWGPGQTALQFDDGGIRLQPGDRIVLQIHYNNGAGFENVIDSSGMRIYHEDPQGTEYAMDEINIMSIHIPANSTAEESTSCTVQRDVELAATWPHMHEIGSEFEQVVTRADGTEESVVELTGWHFEAQYLYETPIQLYEGDEVTITCRWDNPHDYSVSFGTGTDDEMCFSFMYFEPAHDRFCW